MRAYLCLFAGAVAALLVAFAARADDTDPPLINYPAPAAAPQPKGPFTVTAQASDASQFYPQVFFRHGTTGPYEKPIDMKRKAGTKDTYEAVIPYKSDTITFYIEAYDVFGNGPARAGDPDKPFKVAMGDPLPPAPPPVVAQKSAPVPDASVQAPVATSSNSGTMSSSSGGSGRTWTWIVGGVGLGVLAGGLVAGLAVKTEDDAYKQALNGTTNPNGTTQVNDPGSLQAQHDANASLGTKATILTITGSVLLAGGVALYFIEGASMNSSSNDPGSPRPNKPNPKNNEPGFSGENDVPPAQSLPAVSSLSVGAAPVQGGGAVAVAGHF